MTPSFEAELDKPYEIRSMEEAFKLAETKDCDVVQGEPDVLLCDYDGAALDLFHTLVEFLNTYYGPVDIEFWYSSAGKNDHYHRKITLARPVPIGLRLAMQAALGSDPMRTMLDIRRVEEGVEEPCLLFKPRKTVEPTPEPF